MFFKNQLDFYDGILKTLSKIFNILLNMTIFCIVMSSFLIFFNLFSVFFKNELKLC